MKKLAAAALSAGLLYGGWYGYNLLSRLRQIRTVADLQIISKGLQSSHSKGEKLTAREISEEIKKWGRGLDGWGNEFSFQVNASGSYVIVSPGRDGKLDLSSLEDYFSATPDRVHGEYDRDIFFRDGLPVWKAGN